MTSMTTTPRPRRRLIRWTFAVAVCAALVGGFIAVASQRHHAGARSMTYAVNEPGARDADRFTLVVFNMHHGKGMDGVTDLSRTAAVIGDDADLVALHEVYAATWTGRDNQAHIVAHHLGMAPYYFCAERRYFRDHYGNALLAAVPVSQWRTTPLPAEKTGGRHHYIHVTAHVGGRAVQLLIAHLGWEDADAQLPLVLDAFAALEPPAILAGDLNVKPGHPRLTQLFASDACDVIGDYTDAADNRVDWIITRGLDCLEAALTDTDASDHPVLRATLTFTGETQSALDTAGP